MDGVNTYFCAYTVNFWDSCNAFETFILTILLKNAKLNIKKKKKKAIQVFQNFESVGKGQTNIFFI